ncbi:MAG TPA: aminotransferase, partial [Phycicoccus sp.]
GDYVFDPVTGRWRHRAGVVEPPIRLGEVRYGADGTVSMPRSDAVGGEEMLADQLREAAEVLAAATPPGPGHDRHVSVDFEHLRWFDLPEGSVVTAP